MKWFSLSLIILAINDDLCGLTCRHSGKASKGTGRSKNGNIANSLAMPETSIFKTNLEGTLSRSLLDSPIFTITQVPQQLGTTLPNGGTRQAGCSSIFSLIP